MTKRGDVFLQWVFYKLQLSNLAQFKKIISLYMYYTEKIDYGIHRVNKVNIDFLPSCIVYVINRYIGELEIQRY